MIIKLIILIFGTTLCLSGAQDLPIISFEKSMGFGGRLFEKKYHEAQANKNHYILMSDLFNKFYTSPKRNPHKVTIPYLIHQIWVGGTPVPSKYKKLIESWKKRHPHWKHKLWLDKDVEKLVMKNRSFYNATEDPIEKANIVRYEILYQFGGLYADIDFKCVRSFEPLHQRFDFYTGVAPHDCSATLNNALIACGPRHPIMKHCINTIKDDIGKHNRFERTGVMHYTRSFFDQQSHAPGATIALPPAFFYPFGKTHSKDFDFSQLSDETFAVHYWGSTPVKKTV